MADTIAAISTGNVVSAIGILRLSGDRAISVADAVFRPTGGGSMAKTPDRKLRYGALTSPDGAVLDWCLCTVSRAPHTYTGEDTAEFQCHGSPVALREGLEALFAAGARQALPGEFTKRAFLNGKLDLSGAEAVIDLIEAESPEAVRNAAGQVGGALARKAGAVYDDLCDVSAHFHAVLDYPDDDIDPFQLDAYAENLKNAQDILTALVGTCDRGRLLRQGVRCAILGRPNVGKSSLLNALVGSDRAIVTPIPGTTRDVVEDAAVIAGKKFRFFDTAGVRETEDTVERIGVERARETARGADLVLAVLDASRPLTAEDEAVLAEAAAGRRAVVALNKSDLPRILALPETLPGPAVPVSALTGGGLEELCRALAEPFGAGEPVPPGEILTNARQADALRRALSAVRSARTAAAYGVTPDIVLTQVEEAMAAVGEVTGRTVREDVTERIFGRFCVGK